MERHGWANRQRPRHFGAPPRGPGYLAPTHLRRAPPPQQCGQRENEGSGKTVDEQAREFPGDIWKCCNEQQRREALRGEAHPGQGAEAYSRNVHEPDHYAEGELEKDRIGPECERFWQRSPIIARARRSGILRMMDACDKRVGHMPSHPGMSQSRPNSTDWNSATRLAKVRRRDHGRR